MNHLKMNHLKGCHTQTPRIVPLAKVAVDNAETESSVCSDDPGCWLSEAHDASGLSVVTLCRNTILPFFLLYYAWQILT